MLLLISLFLIFSAFYGISLGVNAVMRLFSRGRAGRVRTANPVVPATEPSALHDTLGRYIADLDRLFELQQCGALTRHEFETLKHNLIQRMATAS